MGLRDTVKRMFGGSKRENAGAERATKVSEAAEEEVRVPEVTANELMREMNDGADGRMLLLDCREHFERAQSFIPDSLHIPMNSIPHRLTELDPNREIVVYCAHGNRSYGVAGWLNQQGYRARSLKGGIVEWEHKHGPVESGYRARS